LNKLNKENIGFNNFGEIQNYFIDNIVRNFWYEVYSRIKKVIIEIEYYHMWKLYMVYKKRDFSNLMRRLIFL
jgi:hypothetical protein